jgi:putative transposase
MSYPQRFFEPGYVWHITGRCHNRDFLLEKILYRKIFTTTLAEVNRRYRISILNFTVTSNHFHLLVVAPENRIAIPNMMRDLASKVAAAYNKKTDRKGGFWERRYHATAVESGEHLVRCSLYIDTNMNRAGVVKHPLEWKDCGLHEILKPKQRYALIDVQELSRLAGMPEARDFPEHYAGWIDSVLKKGCLSRDNIWTAQLAVGSTFFVDYIRKKCGYTSPLPEKHHIVREQQPYYGVSTDEPSNMLEWAYLPPL